MLEKMKKYENMDTNERKAYWYHYSTSLETLLVDEEELLSINQKVEISAEQIRVFNIIKDLMQGNENIKIQTNKFINENYKQQTRSLWSVTSEEHKNLLSSVKRAAVKDGYK